jgi:hypothetical protein
MEENNKKIFLDNLPKKEINKKSERKQIINWIKSVGLTVDFIYEDIQGQLKIIDYDTKKQALYIKYLDNEIYKIGTQEFINCRIGGIIGKVNYKHTYQIGDIITDVASGKLKILEQIRIGKNQTRAYKYQCLNCGNIDTITESSLNNHNGCNGCCISPQKVLIGYNDMWTTNSELASLLANPNDGYKYTEHSEKEVDWLCHNCGNIVKNKIIANVNKQGLSCPKCSDGISYPEKIMYSVLEQLNLDFTTQLSKSDFKWCNNYKYDFYFKYNNEGYIIETHGLQHYRNCFHRIKGTRTLEEEQENDRLKKELAIHNGVKEENYIVIDCRKSELEWIRDNDDGILNSKLNNIFNLSKIDWNKCEEFILSSLVKIACDYKKDNPDMTTVDIGKMMKIHYATIIRYLKKGTKLGWCNYNPKEEMKKCGYKIGGINKRKVICLNNNLIFESIAEANRFYNINNSHIFSCCIGKRNYCGKLEDGTPLRWMYYEDYIIQNNNQEILQ